MVEISAASADVRDVILNLRERGMTKFAEAEAKSLGEYENAVEGLTAADQYIDVLLHWEVLQKDRLKVFKK